MSKQKMIIIVMVVMVVIVSVLAYAFYFDRSVTPTVESDRVQSGSAAVKSTADKGPASNNGSAGKSGPETTDEASDIASEIDAISADDFRGENLSDSEIGL